MYKIRFFKNIKIFFQIALLFLYGHLLGSSCKQNKQVLAFYTQDGQKKEIVRQEMRWFVYLQRKLNKQSKSKVNINIQEQHRLLKNYALDTMLAHEASKNKSIVESETYQKYISFLTERAHLAAYELYLRTEDKPLQYDFVELQLLFLGEKKSHYLW